MQLDRNFVKSLNPPLSGLLLHGELQGIADRLGLSPLTVRNTVHGANTNAPVVEEAIRCLIRQRAHIEAVLSRLPEELVERLAAELLPQPTA